MSNRLSKKNLKKKLQKTGGLNLEEITPLTFNQEQTFEAYDNGFHLLLHGMAGTGKTFLSLYLALDDILSDTIYHNVKIIRSAVPTRDMGFLPGKEVEKMGIYEQPYKSICTELFNRGDAYSILKQHGLVEFISTSYVRGMTFDDCIVVVDEVNNMTFHELDSIITRLGNNCRVIFCGDYRQSDLTKRNDKEGLHNFMNIISCLKDFCHIEFIADDIVRGQLVKDYIIARERIQLSA